MVSVVFVQSSRTNISQVLRLEINWIYSSQAIWLILHCCWLRWELQFPVPHSRSFAHERQLLLKILPAELAPPPSWDHLMIMSMDCISVACGVTSYPFVFCLISRERFVVLQSKKKKAPTDRTRCCCHTLTTCSANRFKCIYSLRAHAAATFETRRERHVRQREALLYCWVGQVWHKRHQIDINVYEKPLSFELLLWRSNAFEGQGIAEIMNDLTAP